MKLCIFFSVSIYRMHPDTPADIHAHKHKLHCISKFELRFPNFLSKNLNSEKKITPLHLVSICFRKCDSKSR